MASFTSSQTVFEGNDLLEWMKHFRLECLQPVFDELGVGTCDDLADVYSDDGHITMIRSKLKPLEFKRFGTNAPKLTKCLIGQPISSLLISSDTAMRADTSGKFEGQDIKAWIKHFKIEGVIGKLETLGVATCADLVDIYSDDDFARQIQSTASPIEWKRFKTAAALTTALEGQTLCSLISADTTAVGGGKSAGGGGSVISPPPKAVTSTPPKAVASLSSLEKELEKLELQQRLPAASDKSEIHKIEEKLRLMKTRTREISALIRLLKGSASVDLCILMDCTSSMRPYIKACQSHIADLASRIKEYYPEIELRMSFVGYRDHCDGANRLSILPFGLDNVEEFKSFVGRQNAVGGGDFAEDVHGGLKVASDQDWASATRVLYHVADAPCHGRQYHTGVGDDYPDGHPKDTPAEQLMAALKRQQIIYFFGRLDPSTDTMIREFNKLMPGAEPFVTVEEISADTMMTSITKSVAISMSRSVSSSWKSGSSELDPKYMREVVLNEAEPDWDALPVETVHKYAMTEPTSIKELVDADDDFGCVSSLPTVIYTKVAPFAFAKGGLRAASKARETDECGSKAAAVVHKESLSTKPKHVSQQAYEDDLAGHRVATFLANEFNKVAAPRGIPRVAYVEASVCQFLTQRGRPYFAQEGLVDGIWEKYNNNTGYIQPNPSLRGGVDHSAVQAFSHWTHHVTGAKMMVLDCQGSYDSSSNSFMLTDPAVQCTDVTRFDRTNMGGEGMRRFFSTHRCNDHCRVLGIPAAGV